MLTLRQTLTAARNGVTKSRGASLRAKTFMDAGYSNIRERDTAMEELRQSVEQLTDVIEYLVNEEDKGEHPSIYSKVLPEVESEMEERRYE